MGMTDRNSLVSLFHFDTSYERYGLLLETSVE